jgi:hypothetical protein
VLARGMELAEGKGPLGQRASSDRLRSANSMGWTQGKSAEEEKAGQRGGGSWRRRLGEVSGIVCGKDARAPPHAHVYAPRGAWTPAHACALHSSMRVRTNRTRRYANALTRARTPTLAHTRWRRQLEDLCQRSCSREGRQTQGSESAGERDMGACAPWPRD